MQPINKCTCRLFKYKQDFFSSADISAQNKITLLLVRQAIPINVIMHFWVSV